MRDCRHAHMHACVPCVHAYMRRRRDELQWSEGRCEAATAKLRARHAAGWTQGLRRQQLVVADRALSLLNLLPQAGRAPDTALWNALVECAGFSGQLTRAANLLDDMVTAGCHPDSRTFVALITACNAVRPLCCLP
jgi:pentatricopeptide repeat protein